MPAIFARTSLVSLAGLFALSCSSSDADPAQGSSAGASGGGSTAAAGNAGSSSTAGAPGAGSGGAPSGGVSGAGTGGEAGSSGSAGASGGSAGGPMVPPFPPDANFPYVITNYDEPYRGQVHFSAPMGWLNDSNGMWFDGGLYHFSYQAYPYELGGGPKHWGHASSPDLVHWTHWPIMLDPELVPGDVWSGSTVVDTNNTSGLQTGDGPVLVTLYTATSIGTCVAYSNDQGMTWQAYDQNPVAMGGPNADTRDPHVFWHEPSGKWVSALYENGTTFYSSPDLLNWTETSNINFGFECPDIFELPIDGDAADKKWVLQDAGGAYLLGAFDGSEFTPDSNTPLKMDASSGFYAAQTFYRQNFPDQRVVQMPWIRGMDGATAPWNQVIGFPVEVKLITFPDGVRVARTPIAEIAQLYEETTHFDAEVVAQGVNPFAALESKVFDLEVEIDLGQTSATSITFQLADLSFSLDLGAMELFETSFSALEDRIKIRILRDWGQYEVFANDGEVVFTSVHPFDPSDASLSMTGNGAIGLASADFRQLGRAWPGEAAQASTIVDDDDPGVTYTGEWHVAPESRYFGASARYNGAGTAFEVAFSGTRVEWYGLKNTDLGRADIYLDDTLVASAVEAYSPRRQNALLFTQGELANTAHVLRVVVTGEKDPASLGTALVHDYIVAYVD